MSQETAELVVRTGLHRDTVYVNCKELIDRKDIWSKSGKNMENIF